MPKTAQTPASVINALMIEYQLNPNSLSKAVGLSQSAVRLIAIGKARVTVPIAIRLAKFFSQTPDFWINLQIQEEMRAAANDKDLQAALKSISKAVKPTSSIKSNKTTMPAKKETLADKRKKAAKTSGSKASLRKLADKK